MRDRLKDRHIGERRKQTTRHDDRFATHSIGQGAENDEEGRANDKTTSHQNARGQGIHIQHLREKNQDIKLAGVPDNRFTH